MLAIMKPFDGQPATVGNGVMVGFALASRAGVDSIHRKALTLGCKDEGAVGLRGGDWYCGYFRDLEGNKLMAFSMAA
jgi:predicted lactoylglutathione lyase